MFSQFGEIANINLIREKETGKSKGFCFICYEDQRSTILSVDNFNGMEVCGRPVRVDHVEEYKVPKVCLFNTHCRVLWYRPSSPGENSTIFRLNEVGFNLPRDDYTLFVLHTDSH